MLHRLVDRLRPWTGAPPAGTGPTEVVVIGGGAAGLATAACLGRVGIRAVVLDAAPEPGSTWRRRYDHLRLNTVRWQSDLPGWRLRPHHGGRWLTGRELADYLVDYEAHHRLDVRRPVRVTGLRPRADGWEVRAVGPDGEQAQVCRAVVLALGHAGAPRLPDWPGRSGFTGELTHTADYRRPAPYVGRQVLVVGGGSSGGEIAVALDRAGAQVALSVRTPTQVLPREAHGVPLSPVGIVADHLPRLLVDAVGGPMERLVVGPRDFLPPPPRGMATLLAEGREPTVVDGLVAALRSGRISAVAAVDRMDDDAVHLVDATVLRPDVVLAATGYEDGAAALLAENGLDVDAPPPGLVVVGRRAPFAGTLWGIDADARGAARRLRHRPAVAGSTAGIRAVELRP